MHLNISALPVSETNYAQTMETVVEPYLQSVGEDGFFTSFDGNNIHYESYRAASPVGVVVLYNFFLFLY